MVIYGHRCVNKISVFVNCFDVQVGNSFRTSADLFTSEYEINEVPIAARNLLTKGHTQEEINQFSGM
jgi:hypothetical protein